MELKPLGERVLIRRKGVKKVGLIYIPSDAKKANVGEVVAIGDGVTTLVVGDLIMFGQYAPLIVDDKELSLYGVEVTGNNEGDEFLILNEGDALCAILDDAGVANA